MNKTLVGWVIWGIILPIYIGIVIRQYKDTYEPTSISWNVTRASKKFGGGAALVRQMVHHARELKCRFLAASMLDKDAAGFWRAAGLKA